MINKRKLFFLFGLTVILIGCLQWQKNPIVQAKSNDGIPIEIDKDTDVTSSLPFDTNKLFEPDLLNNEAYQGYSQGESVVDIFERGNLHTYYINELLPWSVGGNLAYQLDNGNVIVVLLITARGSAPSTSEQVAVYMTPDGEVLDLYRQTTDAVTVAFRFETIMGQGSEPNSVLVMGKDGINPTIFELKIVKEKIESKEISKVEGYGGRTINTDGFFHVNTDKLIMPINLFPKKTLSSYPIELVSLDSTHSMKPELKLDVPNHRLIENPQSLVVTLSQLNQADNECIVSVSSLGTNMSSTYIHAIEVFRPDGTHIKTLFSTEVVGANDSIKRIPSKREKNKFYYFISSEKSKSKIVEVDLTTMNPKYKVLKEFEPETNLIINEAASGNTFSYFGYLSELNEDFSSYPINGNSIVSGSMDTNFNVQSVSTIDTEKPLYFYNVMPLGIDAEGLEKVVAFGKTEANLDGNFPTPLKNDAQKQFFGVFRKKQDYAPAINAIPAKTVNINAFTTKTVDELLLTEDVQQEMIRVYDQIDSNKEIEGIQGQEWLNNRINRNPKQLSNPIDWRALGFNKNKTGPQSVTYFATDSQVQTSTVSRWVNTITDQTTKQEEIYFDAQNFSVPLKDVQTDIPDEETFKKLAETMAWNEVTHEIYEDGKKQQFSDKVTVNQQQLADLQHATEAKPYPVDVTIEVIANSGSTGGPGIIGPGDDDDDLDPGGTGTGGGGWVGSGSEPIKVTNRVWVFVTTKNTVVDKDTGIVIYADDYRLPLQSAKNESIVNVFVHSNVKVYHYYDNTHETDTELSTIADSKNTTGLTVKNLTVITEAQKPSVVQPEISFTWDKGTTSTTPDVTLYAALLLHTRQVILNQSDELPILNKGYLTLIYGAPHEANLTITSGLDENNLTYTTSQFDFDQNNTGHSIDFSLIVPEYYRYKGYVVSDKDIPHQASALVEQAYQYSLRDDPYEIWLTSYIEPIRPNSPKPYSWNYQENELGELKPH